MRNFPFYIARRYLFSRKSHHAINIISAISVCGVALASMALVCTLSVFNGFRDMVASYFTAFDPQLKVVPVRGKTVAADDEALMRLRSYGGIAVYTECLEDNALIYVDGRQQMVSVKGVDDNFEELTDIRKLLYGDGDFLLHSDVREFGILGIRLASALGVGTYFEFPLQVYAPKKGERINAANPSAAFKQDELYAPSVLFAVNQFKYDAGYVLTSLGFAQRLFSATGQVSAVELKLRKGQELGVAKEEIALLLGDRFRVLDRYEQQADVFRIMEIEKLIAYVFLSFILLVACFNIIGSLSMLILDKREDIVTLRNLGATETQIVRIFLFEGRLIAFMGAFVGTVIGVLLCYLQQTFGFITLGDTAGNFLTEAYPVSVDWRDILLIFVTVLVVGLVVLWYPIRYLSKRLLDAPLA